MADKTQEMNGNGADMSQQISDAIRPVMEDLQEQITTTVQEQMSGETSSNGVAEALSLDSLGGLGETLQSTLDSAVEKLQPVLQWILEKVQQLINWIISLFVGGEESSEESEESEESSESEEEESEEAEEEAA